MDQVCYGDHSSYGHSRLDADTLIRADLPGPEHPHHTALAA